MFKKFIVFIIVGILLGISFAIIFTCQKISLAYKTKYPRVRCERYEDNYLGHHDEWKADSIKEYILNQKLEFDYKPTRYEGAL